MKTKFLHLSGIMSRFDVSTVTTLVNCLLTSGQMFCAFILYVATLKLTFYFPIFILLNNLNNAKYVGGVLINQKCKEFIHSVFCKAKEVVTKTS